MRMYKQNGRRTRKSFTDRYTLNSDGHKPFYETSVGVVAINNEGRVLMMECRLFEGCWKLPQGMVMPNEKQKSAAVRVLKEEVEFKRARVICKSKQQTVYDYPDENRYIYGVSGQIIHWYLVKMIGNSEVVSPRHIELVRNGCIKGACWVEPEKVTALVCDGFNDNEITRQRYRIYADILAEFTPTIERMLLTEKSKKRYRQNLTHGF